MKVVIIQSNYLPWKGYFDLIMNADVCIFLDSVQFTKNDWRNRNLIKRENGKLQWLSIPVGQSISRRINEVELPASKWREQHLNLFSISYRNSPFHDLVYETYKELIFSETKYLSNLNQLIIEGFLQKFFKCKITFVNDFQVISNVKNISRNARLRKLLVALKADTYLSGPRANQYISETEFRNSGINIKYANYDRYPEYHQNGTSFNHNVSILDLIAWKGYNAIDFLKMGKLFDE